MPYKNIVFIKLEKRLLYDPRWLSLSPLDQLTYVKLILLAAHTYNVIPKHLKTLSRCLNSNQRLTSLEQSLKNIMASFPKLREKSNCYYFEEFDTKTNYIPDLGNPKEIPGKSLGHPKEVTDKEEDKEVDVEKEKKTTYRGFVKPSAEELQNYAFSISYKIDTEAFLAHYESNGWMVGKNKMRDWKAAVRTWKARSKSNSASNERQETKNYDDGWKRYEAERSETNAKTVLSRIGITTKPD